MLAYNDVLFCAGRTSSSTHCFPTRDLQLLSLQHPLNCSQSVLLQYCTSTFECRCSLYNYYTSILSVALSYYCLWCALFLVDCTVLQKSLTDMLSASVGSRGFSPSIGTPDDTKGTHGRATTLHSLSQSLPRVCYENITHFLNFSEGMCAPKVLCLYVY